MENLEQMRSDYNELREIIDGKDDEMIDANTKLIESKLSNFKKEIDIFMSEKSLLLKSVKSDIQEMATIDHVSEKFKIIDNELKNYKWRTEDEMSKKVNQQLIIKILTNFEHIINKIDSQQILTTRKIPRKDLYGSNSKNEHLMNSSTYALINSSDSPTQNSKLINDMS